ncbi:hypothetical protein Tsubulata_040692 [Turnera subulata]|uniref:Uncharacterized protein n=1 Tax=Turnera subulata TaxID=218843 RepID=A0A9Q0G3F6_9ROSI|nr:hypothetical protein Tsubulata_040692 [Turnera subulata]
MEKDTMEEVLITTVFVYMSHFDYDGEVSHSLYAIEMPNPLTATTPSHHEDHHHQQPIKCSKPLQFSLIHQFSASKYPFDMCCAKLGDQLYFLGGMLDITGDFHPRLDLSHFPPSVCSFRPSTGELEDAALPPMKSGKNSPLSFVADDNLYVLGSFIPRLVSTASPTYFEVFKHGTGWTTLVPPPLLGDWDSCSIVGRKVLVLGHYGEHFCLAFHLDTRQWTKIFEPGACNRREVENLPLWTSSSSSPINEQGSSKKNAAAAAAAVYGVRSDGKLFITEGHSEAHKLLTSHSWNQVSLVQDGAGVHPFFPEEYPKFSLSLCYLGNGCFCYLAMGSDFLNHGAVESEGDQFILTVLFKDNILHRDHEEAQPSSASQAFQVECIHFAHEIKLLLKNIWRIENSFVFRLTPKQINILTARAAEAGAGYLDNTATCDTGALERMGSNLSNQECEVQKKCEQKIKKETLEEMEAQFRKIVANVQPDIRAQIAKELAQRLLDRYAVLT